MASEILVNIGSGNGLLLDGTKSLPEWTLIDHQSSLAHLRVISQDMLKISILDMSLKITNSRLQLYLPGATNFKFSWCFEIWQTTQWYSCQDANQISVYKHQGED